MKWAIFVICQRKIMLRATVLQFPKAYPNPKNMSIFIYIFIYIYKYSSKSYPSNTLISEL